MLQPSDIVFEAQCITSLNKLNHDFLFVRMCVPNIEKAHFMRSSTDSVNSSLDLISCKFNKTKHVG